MRWTRLRPPLAPACQGDAAAFDFNAPPDVQGWGVTHDNRRRFSREVSGLSASDLGELELHWAVAFPDAVRARSQPAIAGGSLFGGFGRLFGADHAAVAKKSDKRVILVDGEAVGAINRVPAAGETRSNMHVGGRPEKIGLSDRDLEICKAIGPLLKEKGQIFVGIDVIGDYLTEINVTSPTGIQELERFDGLNIAQKIWQAIEAKRA